MARRGHWIQIMQFTLRYVGELHSSNADDHKTRIKRAPEIWGIRRQIHRQMELLWKRPPLSQMTTHHEFRNRSIKGQLVRPLVCADAHLLASLNIVIQRQDDPGNLVNNNGDLDNRIKTLFDGLRGPIATDKGEIPDGLPTPLFCLLEDDFLISELSLRTEHLLLPPPDHDSKAWVEVMINVKLLASAVTMFNLSFLRG